MLVLRRLLVGLSMLSLILLSLVAGSDEAIGDGRALHALVGTPSANPQAALQDAALDPYFEEFYSDSATVSSSPPCVGESGTVCTSRDVSQFSLFEDRHLGAGFAYNLEADSVEDVLEKGLSLSEASPVHLVVRGTSVDNSTRCDWRGIARTAAQREQAIRLWLGIDAAISLPSAAEIERLFIETMDAFNNSNSNQIFSETDKANFMALARGGLTTDYFILTCYIDYTASEYVLGAGPTTLTVAYDHTAQTRSYDLYRRAHAAGELGSDALLSESAYLALLNQALWDVEDALSGIVEGRESVVFLAPMGAHHAIAIEAWQVVAQWDVQTVDGTVNAVRYGAYEGDPEHTQTLANLQITDHNGGDERCLCQ